MNRVDSLLQELSSRHRNDDSTFLGAVRPLVVAILDGNTPDHARVPLMELLAETFERDRQVRKDLQQAQTAWAALIANITRLLQR